MNIKAWENTLGYLLCVVLAVSLGASLCKESRAAVSSPPLSPVLPFVACGSTLRPRVAEIYFIFSLLCLTLIRSQMVSTFFFFSLFLHDIFSSFCRRTFIGSYENTSLSSPLLLTFSGFGCGVKEVTSGDTFFLYSVFTFSLPFIMISTVVCIL